MKKAYLFAAVAAAAFATQANAAALIGASVTGPSGTIWDTTQNTTYTLFLQSPQFGQFINGTDPSINFTPTGSDNILLSGEGFRPGETVDSDALYTLTLNFADGATLTGTYTPVGNQFLSGGSTTVGNTTYNLTDFSWRRFRGNTVSAYTPVPGGDDRDYVGNFEFTSGAVPEPAAWAMMIGGFGLVGGSLRTRRAKANRVSYAA